MSPSNHKKDRRTVFGAVLIIAGVFLILRELDVLRLPYYVYSWKTILIGLGAIFFIFTEKKGTGLVLIVIGGVFMLEELTTFNLDLIGGPFPVLLVVLGIYMLVRSRGTSVDGRPKTEIIKGDNNFIDEIAIFGGGERIITAKDFKGGRTTIAFGGMELDLSPSTIGSEPAVIDVFTIFGGIELRVPEDWVVKVEVTAIFGGFNDNRKKVKTYTIVGTVNEEGEKKVTEEKVLIIKGLVLFGGGEIKSA